MQRIVILNPKGGAGKTTVATNLAARLALAGRSPALMDLDSQGSSIRWLSRRPEKCRRIYGIEGFKRCSTTTRSWQLRLPPECGAVVVDTPAALEPQHMPEMTRGATAILVPVMPSEIDIHATAKCIADLLLIAKIPRSGNRIGIVANRVRANTRISRSLMRFLESLSIPIVATLRDTQNYVAAAQEGIGICEMPQWKTERDRKSWEGLLDWLSDKRATTEATDYIDARQRSLEARCSSG